MEKNILVALDDSENAMRAVESIVNSFTPDHKVTLFSVIPDTAAICDVYSPGLSPHFLSQRSAFCALEDKKKELMNEAQKKAKELLIKAGFKEENITLKAEKRKKGIARDIINEAHSGYSTVVLGRRGLSGIKEFFLGSVSHKVVNAMKELSILLVD